jgi:MFS family permease
MSDRLLTRDFGLLVLAHLLQAVGYASMLLLPVYITELGADRTQVGWVMGAGAIGGLVLRPLAGWAIDTIGRRSTIFIGTVALVAGMALIAWVDRVGPLLYTSRVLVGAGAGTLFTAYFAFAADIIPISRRTEGIALFGVSGLLPLIVNPIADRLQIAPLELRWFLPAVGVIALASLLPLWPLKEPPKAPKPAESLPIRKALTQRALLPVWWATVIFASGVAMFFAFASVTAMARGVPHPKDLWFGYAGAAITIRLFGARLPDRIGPHNLIAPALAVYATCFLLMAEAETSMGFLLAGICGGIGHGYCFPVLAGQVVARSDAAIRGAALACFTGLWEFVAIVFTPLCGMVADAIGDAGMFAGGALVCASGLIIWAVLERRGAAA